jgi:hypothetical protein
VSRLLLDLLTTLFRKRGRLVQPLLIAASAALIFFREPRLLIHPRLWAEEGAVYLAEALRLPWWKTLVSTQRGYFALLPNATSVVAAKVLPLTLAPWVTTIASFALQLVASAIVALAPSKFWRTNLHRTLIILALSLSWNSHEVWLNAVNGQFWCVCIAFFILLTNHVRTSRRLNTIYCIGLAFCGLNGVGACILMPLFLLRAMAERESRTVGQALALGAASAVQLVCVILAITAGATSDRLNGGQPQLFLEFVLVRGVLRGFVDPDMAWSMMPHKYWVVAGLLLIAVFLSSARGWRGLFWFIGGFLLTAVISLKFAVRQTPAPRYFFAPSVILLVMLIASIDLRVSPFPRLQFARCFLAAAALVLFLHRCGPLYSSDMREYSNPTWPVWPDEVAKWERNRSYHPRIHPCDGGQCWEVALP